MSAATSSSPSTTTTTTTTTTAASATQIWTYLVPFYIGWRIWWANRLPLMDCDEVYNYWEPLHYIIFGNGGFQTWEYSNEFALRTYAYLSPLWALAKVFGVLIRHLPSWWWPLLTSQTVRIENSSSSGDNSNRVALFILLRATLAAVMALAEISFCKALAAQKSSNNEKASYYNTILGLVTASLLLSSAGMSHAAGALLPSSTIMFFWLIASTAFLQQRPLTFVVAAVVATLAVGWPFGVLMFVPMGIALLYEQRHRLVTFVLQIVVITAIVQGAVMWIDFQQYQKVVSPTWNIIMYNTKGRGDELYGIEPLSYYIKNLILNFNYVVVGMAALPVVVLLQRNYTLATVLVPMYIWVGVVFPRPHKEERFLFPIYPCICLGAAILSVGAMDVYFSKVVQTPPPRLKIALLIQGLLWAPAAVLSFGRTYALSLYYTAPLYVYAQLQQQPDVVDSVICTCGEWYRFPSSFYLPSTIQSFGFVKSSFEGQLPHLFVEGIGSGPNNPNQFNDANLAEPGSYVNSIDDCDYLIDLWSSEDCRENDSLWMPVAQGSFLDADRTSTIHRVLYLPHLHEQEQSRGGVVYDDYVLYQKRYVYCTVQSGLVFVSRILPREYGMSGDEDTQLLELSDCLVTRKCYYVFRFAQDCERCVEHSAIDTRIPHDASLGLSLCLLQGAMAMVQRES
jgi:alpha-1,2-mannosyltransferase